MDIVTKRFKVKVRLEIDYEMWIQATSPDSAAKQAEKMDFSEVLDEAFSVDFRDSTAIAVDGNKEWK